MAEVIDIVDLVVSVSICALHKYAHQYVVKETDFNKAKHPTINMVIRYSNHDILISYIL